MDAKENLAHEIWAAAQVPPDGSIEDAVDRVRALLGKPDLTHARIAEIHIDSIRALEAKVHAHEIALRTIAEFPGVFGDNLPAYNMRQTALRALDYKAIPAEMHMSLAQWQQALQKAFDNGKAYAELSIDENTHFMHAGEGFVAAWVWQDSGRIFYPSRITSEHQANVTVRDWKKDGPVKGIDYKVVEVVMRKPQGKA